MERCEYWLPESRTQWCELMSGACKCEGNEAHCAIHGASISSFVNKQEREITREECLRDQKKRSHNYLS
ncbi:MAG: hypothetical protein ABFD83_13940 [Armatimonadota bacterium]